MDARLKQRLIGAAVLVALAVIFLPMLVQGPAPDSGVSDLSLDRPNAPRGGTETRDLPLVAPGASGDRGAVLSDDGALPTVDTATADPAGDVASSPGTAGGDYAVAFGTYGTRENAGTVVTRLVAEGLPAWLEPAQAYGKPAWRVRIGPYATRAEAEDARIAASRLRSNVAAKVIALDSAPPAAAAATAAAPHPDAADPAPPRDRPAAAAPAPASSAAASRSPPAATAAAAPAARATPSPAALPAPSPAAPSPAPAPRAAAATGFAVQVGAFSKPEDAAAMQAKLRAAGISAFVDTVDTDKGRLTRVKAGPVVDRAEADRLKARVRSATGVDGLVRAHP